MKVNNPEKRLNQFWGLVDQKHVAAIAEKIVGKNVLDMGSGLGTTTKQLTDLGYNCIGFDYDADSVEYCKQTYPNCKFEVANAEQLPYEDNYFDTIILRDALHHFYCEGDFEKISKEMIRVSKNNARIIFFDPNVNFLIKTLRKISAHEDVECKFETAMEIMQKLGGTNIQYKYNTVYSLQLSGGYVGVNFVPNVKFIQKMILSSERVVESIFNKIGLGRYLCWRYVITADLKK